MKRASKVKFDLPLVNGELARRGRLESRRDRIAFRLHTPAMIEPEPNPPNRPEPADDSAGSGSPLKPLSADEQMAAFEEALKEEDWGHQPC